MKLKDVIKRGVALRPKDKWPTFDGQELDRAKFVTSSEVGKCARMIWFAKYAAKHDIPPPKEPSFDTTGWGYWARGHNVEAWVVEQLRRADAAADFQYIGDEQVSFYHHVQSGTPDGIMIDAEGVTVFDIKSMDPRKGAKGLPDPAHVDQIHQNMDLIEQCTNLIPSKGKLIYVNCSNYEDMREYDIERDVDRMDHLYSRAQMIMNAKSAEDVEPEGIYNNGCGYCSFKSHCNDAQMRAKELKKEAQEREGVANNVFR